MARHAAGARGRAAGPARRAIRERAQCGALAPLSRRDLGRPLEQQVTRVYRLLEDLVQFLIQECRFDARDGWRQHVEDGRERWRRRQAASVVRDVPDEAARVLRELGYAVTDPSDVKLPSAKALRNW